MVSKIVIYFDTSAWINLKYVKNKAIYSQLLELINNGKVEVIISHAVNDEIKTIINDVPIRKVPTGCCVLGYSRLGHARLGDPDEVYAALTKDIPDKSQNRNAVWDAIHYVTAHFEKADFFITDDLKLKRKVEERISNHVNVISLNELSKVLN